MQYVDGKLQRNLWVGKIGFNAMKQDELISSIYQMPTEKNCPYVVFTGVQIIVGAESSERIAAAQNEATICAVDGMPIHWLAKRKKIESERCGGPDIMWRILKEGVQRNYRHYFYGNTQKVLDTLRSKLMEEIEGINIVGMYSPPFRELSKEEEAAVIRRINEAKPDFVWVGLGAPKQDFWMQKYRNELVNTRLMGVGAAFNFLSGKISRAPVWMQKMGMEWCYRMLIERGHLWKRYLIGAPKFIGIVIRDVRKERKRKRLS
ncbi:MAG: WecB/TagA/CpsF family glycosyltransferase [Lachnospiraceae bacterium]|nr:WecB/TagA/CpsF family glycosyltransferase [Lachnospiraceae bacterium]